MLADTEVYAPVSVVPGTDWRPPQRRDRVCLAQSLSQLLEQRPTPSRKQIEESKADLAVWGIDGGEALEGAVLGVSDVL